MINKRALLVGESFSPWTKKARWALEYCDIDYDYQEYTPTLSEPGLRWKLKQWTGSVSVPALFIDGQVLRDSWEIAQYANNVAGDGRLGDMQEIAPWNDLSEAALAEGRTRVVRCILGSDTALEESIPAFVPKRIRSKLIFVARDAVQRLDRKYAHLEQTGAMHLSLTRTRECLAQSKNDYLMNEFSYADIVMAVVLEVVMPIAEVRPVLGPATQRCWKNADFTTEFEDLLNWRNRLASAAETTYSQFASISTKNDY